MSVEGELYGNAISLHAWPSTGCSALRFINTLQTSGRESCICDDLFHPAFLRANSCPLHVLSCPEPCCVVTERYRA